MVAIAMLAGAAGASILKTNAANAQTASVTPATANPVTPAAVKQTQGSTNSTGVQGTFKSNENPAHEAKESAQWEAQENAGKAPWQQSANGSH